MSLEAHAWFLHAPGEPLRKGTLVLDEPGPGEVLVEVAANGLCHTDLGFWDGSVRPDHPLPLVLGHEAVGTVVAAGPGAERWRGRAVIIPAVLPCGACAYCDGGRGNACPRQRMPGGDVHGAFASHVRVPAAPLVPIDDAPPNVDRRSLCVVADAVSTAYQAVRRAGVATGDLAAVVGAGGVGGFVVQIAAAAGAEVVALDVRPDRLALARQHGAAHALATGDRDPREVRREVQDLAQRLGIEPLRHRIFECAGAPAAQQLAFSLLGRGGTMVQVGFTPARVELRLSNLMAFDATLHGTWGCPPERYADVLRLVYDGRVVLDPFVEYAPMADVNRVLDDMAHHKVSRRVVLLAPP